MFINIKLNNLDTQYLNDLIIKVKNTKDRRKRDEASIVTITLPSTRGRGRGRGYGRSRGSRDRGANTPKGPCSDCGSRFHKSQCFKCTLSAKVKYDRELKSSSKSKDKINIDGSDSNRPSRRRITTTTP